MSPITIIRPKLGNLGYNELSVINLEFVAPDHPPQNRKGANHNF